MGQYYHPVILKEGWEKNNEPVEATLSAHDFDNGLKLMEHSYVGNSLTEAFTNLLGDKPKVVAWVGDYADEVAINGEEHDLYLDACSFMEKDPQDFNTTNTEQYDDLLKNTCTEHKYDYLVNVTKKQYCKVPAKIDDDLLIVHPLPLRTAVGNGRGGGDYWKEDARVGSWAFDRVLATNSIDGYKAMGYVEIDGVFTED